MDIMKTYRNSLLIVAVSMLLSVPFAQGQRASQWVGGTPGQANNWQCPKNWLDGRLPDEFSNVFIPDVSTRSLAYPVLAEVVWINSLRMEGNAQLTIAKGGQLTIYEDAFVPHPYNLKVNGVLDILNSLEGGGNQPATAALAKR